MKARIASSAPEAVEADAVAAVVFEAQDGSVDRSALDGLSGGLIGELRSAGELKGKLFETTLIHRPVGAAAKRLLAIGGGKRSEFNAARLRRCAAAAARTLKVKGVKRMAWLLDSAPSADPAAKAVAEGVTLGLYDADVYKSEDKAEGGIEELILIGAGSPEVIDRGIAIGAAQNFARELAQEPGNLLPPLKLAEKAAAMAQAAGLECEIIDEAKLRKLGMGALLGVSQGSDAPPALIVIRYVPETPSASDVHLGLVGKGVTFDTGGVSIKPAANMDEMKYDMAGAAAVLGAMQAIAALKPPVRVTAVVPAAENMVSARAQRPGDVVTTLSGKTVEVLNTDAEGRMLLADALTYAQTLGCNRLVDAATLTGAIVVALGYERTGLFSNDDEWGKSVLAASEAAGERFWPMPLDTEYKPYLKSEIADLANIGGRWGGAITAAVFLGEFANATPWAHLDIAGTAWLDKPAPDAPKGPSGVGVRSMVELAFSLVR